MSDAWVRALGPGDADAARALVVRQFGGTRYSTRLLEQLDATCRGSDAEYQGFVVMAQHGESLCGFAMFGPVAGAPGAVKVHALVGTDASALRELARTMAGRSAMEHDRLLVCEVADDACCAVGAAALRAGGFVQEGFVRDWFADGVGAIVLVHRVAATSFRTLA